MGSSVLRIDPIEELIVAGYLVAPTGRFRYMDELRDHAKSEAKAIRRAIEGRRTRTGDERQHT